MKLIFSALAGIGISSAAVAQPTCPASTVLPELDAAYHACGHYADENCHNFIAAFKKVTGRYDCKRSFDTGPGSVPAIWLAGDGALEDYVHLVWLLSTKKQFKSKLYRGVDVEARDFFASSEFRGVLDGALAEEYSEKSRAMASSLKKAGP